MAMRQKDKYPDIDVGIANFGWVIIFGGMMFACSIGPPVALLLYCSLTAGMC